MIPENLTHAEVGALLVAVGKHMIDHNVCAQAVLAPDIIVSDEYADKLVRAMDEAEEYNGIERERAEEILMHLNLHEAIEFNEVGARHG